MSETTESLAIGDQVPTLHYQTTRDQQACFADLHGKPIVLYFYPKDNTSGCTREAEDFRDAYEDFRAEKAVILGASRDSLSSHERFIDQLGLPFDLISDQDEALCKAFGVMQIKSMYGRKYWGIERSTFIIDPHGCLAQTWRKVKIDGHVQEVLATLRQLRTAKGW